MQRQQLEEGAEEEVEGVAEAGAAVRVQWTRVQWIYSDRQFFFHIAMSESHVWWHLAPATWCGTCFSTVGEDPALRPV